MNELRLSPDELGLLLTMLALSGYEAEEACSEQQAADLLVKVTNFVASHVDEPVVLLPEKQAWAAQLVMLHQLDVEQYVIRLGLDMERLTERVASRDALIMELARLMNVPVPVQSLDPLGVFEKQEEK